MERHEFDPSGCECREQKERHGFMNALLWPGVWLSTFPLDWNEGAKGDDVLRLDIPERLFSDHEFVPDPTLTPARYIMAVKIYKSSGCPIIRREACM